MRSRLSRIESSASLRKDRSRIVSTRDCQIPISRDTAGRTHSSPRLTVPRRAQTSRSARRSGSSTRGDKSSSVDKNTALGPPDHYYTGYSFWANAAQRREEIPADTVGNEYTAPSQSIRLNSTS
jgi:hypothetical protein